MHLLLVHLKIDVQNSKSKQNINCQPYTLPFLCWHCCFMFYISTYKYNTFMVYVPTYCYTHTICPKLRFEKNSASRWMLASSWSSTCCGTNSCFISLWDKMAKKTFYLLPILFYGTQILFQVLRNWIHSQPISSVICVNLKHQNWVNKNKTKNFTIFHHRVRQLSSIISCRIIFNGIDEVTKYKAWSYYIIVTYKLKYDIISIVCWKQI